MNTRTLLRLCVAGLLAAAAAIHAQTAPQVPVVPPTAGQPALPAAAPVQPIPAGRWTLAQIRQSFDLADSNSDDRLTRAEAQRLAIMPLSFEDMDQNKDGVLDRGEYEGSLAR